MDMNGFRVMYSIFVMLGERKIMLENLKDILFWLDSDWTGKIEQKERNIFVKEKSFRNIPLTVNCGEKKRYLLKPVGLILLTAKAII